MSDDFYESIIQKVDDLEDENYELKRELELLETKYMQIECENEELSYLLNDYKTKFGDLRQDDYDY